jgi:hypothetical protein
MLFGLLSVMPLASVHFIYRDPVQTTAMDPELQRSSHTARRFVNMSIPAFEKL